MGVEELHSFIQALIQSEQLGVGIAKVLRIQSEEMRRKRRQRAEEQAAQASLKMLFPMIIFIFPTIFIVLMGPAVLIIFHNFSGGGNGWPRGFPGRGARTARLVDAESGSEVVPGSRSRGARGRGSGG